MHKTELNVIDIHVQYMEWYNGWQKCSTDRVGGRISITGDCITFMLIYVNQSINQTVKTNVLKKRHTFMMSW